METHNKLIEQIDICRQQEVKIIKLTKNRGDNNENIHNRSNTKEYAPKQAGKINHKKYDEDIDYNHSVDPLIDAKTELLRNDLEAMRSKVLAEILKSNKLIQQKQEIEGKHER